LFVFGDVIVLLKLIVLLPKLALEAAEQPSEATHLRDLKKNGALWA